MQFPGVMDSIEREEEEDQSFRVLLPSLIRVCEIIGMI